MNVAQSQEKCSNGKSDQKIEDNASKCITLSPA